MSALRPHRPDPQAHRPSTSSAYETVVLIHGFGASIHDHWFPWLSRTAPHVERVELPAPGSPRAEDWVPRAASAIGTLRPTTAVVTHSLGGITAVRAIRDLLESGRGDRLGALIAVAPFAAALPRSGDEELDAFLGTGLDGFLAGGDPARIARHLDRAHVLRSDDDALVPAALSESFAARLGAPVEVVPGAGHFCAEDGITELEPVARALGEVPAA